MSMAEGAPSDSLARAPPPVGRRDPGDLAKRSPEQLGGHPGRHGDDRDVVGTDALRPPVDGLAAGLPAQTAAGPSRHSQSRAGTPPGRGATVLWSLLTSRTVRPGRGRPQVGARRVGDARMDGREDSIDTRWPLPGWALISSRRLAQAPSRARAFTARSRLATALRLRYPGGPERGTLAAGASVSRFTLLAPPPG